MTTLAEEPTVKSRGTTVFTLFKTSRFLQLCTAVLVAQLGLAMALNFTQKPATFASTGPLFTLKEDDISSIAINDGDETINLEKADNQWQVAGDVALPVDNARLNTLISSLIELEPGLPVASSENSREQLEVADERYQRKLVINNDEANTFLLGTSPGLRKAHLRQAGKDEIYSAALPVSDMPTSLDQWLDKSLLALKGISRISSRAIAFEKTSTGDDTGWTVTAKNSEGQSLDTEKLTTAVRALETLRVTGLMDSSLQSSDDDTAVSDSEDDSGSPSATLQLSITSAGKEFQLVLAKTGEKATISRSDIDQTFSVSTSLFDQLEVLGSEAGWFVNNAEEEMISE